MKLLLLNTDLHGRLLKTLLLIFLLVLAITSILRHVQFVKPPGQTLIPILFNILNIIKGFFFTILYIFFFGIFFDGGNGFTFQLSIDGSNFYKSETKAFWPILFRVSNVNDSRPFPVSFFCDGEKPPNLNLYLEPFLNELKPLEENGIDVNDRHLMVKLISFLSCFPLPSSVCFDTVFCQLSVMASLFCVIVLR